MEQNVLFQDFEIVGKNMNAYMEDHAKLLALDSTVLITGETGTGKELVARWVHFRDNVRKDRPFVKITIPNIGENIFESEVFGYEKGAFTGAISSKKGLIEVAEAGTVFIDEIENASPAIQSKLLQVLEDKVYRKVGGTEYTRTDARFIIATNVDLQKLVMEGSFRTDLYYRLAVLEINLPALQERGDDILEITNYYIEKYNAKFNKNVMPIGKKQAKELTAYPWPGNVRELKNFIEKCMVFAAEDRIDLGRLKANVPARLEEGFTFQYKAHMRNKERELLEAAYKKAGGAAERMAGLIGMSVPFIYKKLKEYGIK